MVHNLGLPCDLYGFTSSFVYSTVYAFSVKSVWNLDQIGNPKGSATCTCFSEIIAVEFYFKSVWVAKN